LPFEEKTGGFQWDLVIIIPASTLIHDKGLVLKERQASANFYKCGDETSVPHFVTWNPVNSANPDFHKPDFFGKLRFE